MPTDDPVTVWLGRLCSGESSAARHLWDRYFLRLVGLARKRLRAAPRRAADEEDVALSAFNSFCDNARAGRFPDLADRDGLWRLLAAFTARKAARQLRDAARLKRGGTAVAADPAALEEVFGREPDPGIAAEVAEECDRLLAALDDPVLRRVALMRVAGNSVEEVAKEVGCSVTSVKRKLRLIRRKWEGEVGYEPD
jgi:DNA-directed RNA polymerase specialized sigma24 family protein